MIARRQFLTIGAADDPEAAEGRGIDAKLDQKEYGAYQASCRIGKYDSMAFGPLTPFLEPDNFLYGQYHTGDYGGRLREAWLDR